MHTERKGGRYSQFAKQAARLTGHPGVFVAAAVIVLLWGITGPLFHFSDTWQLVINTGTTIVTFLMVFLIQSTQNRDTEAMQIKLNELIRSVQGAHNALLCLEELDDEHLDAMRAKYGELAARARDDLRRGARDTGVPAVEVLERKRSRMRVYGNRSRRQQR